MRLRGEDIGSKDLINIKYISSATIIPPASIKFPNTENF